MCMCMVQNSTYFSISAMSRKDLMDICLILKCAQRFFSIGSRTTTKVRYFIAIRFSKLVCGKHTF